MFRRQWKRHIKKPLDLLDIDKTASEWMDRMLPQMMKAAGVTEELKARDQMAWIGLVNNCKA